LSKRLSLRKEVIFSCFHFTLRLSLQ
jgi:hypothetical protein